MDRRQFMKIAGLSAVLGIGGSLIIDKAGHAGLGAGPRYEQGPNAIEAKRWGMVIDAGKIKTGEDYKRIIKACHSIHNVPDFGEAKDEVKWIWTDDYEHTFPSAENPFMDQTYKEKPFLLMCNHCEFPACVRVCPTKATFKRPDGIVVMDYHRCIGCRFCMAACPFGARSFNWRDPRPFIKQVNPEYPTRMKGVVEKCTFCVERLAKGQGPACAEASNGAMVYGDLMDPNSEIRKILATTYTIRRKPELGTEPSIFYVIGGSENNA
ncbi:MAG: 4Fe-4S dicluster domain-containing protein [Nitrospiraceae bacterium]|nr:4Fe-4S dicluster domain-containing protein [Nitrospiraceae bacterium]